MPHNTSPPRPGRLSPTMTKAPRGLITSRGPRTSLATSRHPLQFARAVAPRWPAPRATCKVTSTRRRRAFSSPTLRALGGVERPTGARQYSTSTPEIRPATAPRVSLLESRGQQSQSPWRCVCSARRAPAARQCRAERRRWRDSGPRGRRARPVRQCWRGAPDGRGRRAPEGRPQLEAQREKTQPPFWPGKPSCGRLHCSSAASARANGDGSLRRTTRRGGSRACSCPNDGRCITDGLAGEQDAECNERARLESVRSAGVALQT